LKKKVASATVLSLFLISALTLTLNIQPAKSDYVWSETIYIRADGSIDPPDAPISTVDNVTYTFIGNINDSIVVERSNIIIDGNEYTLQGSGNENGFYSERTNNVTITRANIKGFKRGVYFSSTSHNIIFGNNITANEWFGICFGNSSNNIIANNSITNNGLGVYFWGSSNNNTVANNNITANGDDGIHLSNSLNNTIASNNIKANNQYGIWLKDSSNKNTITNNNMTLNNGVGIYLSGSLSQCSNNIVGNNNIVNNKNGIFLWDSSNNSIANNNITANNLLGIEVINSINNSIANNNIANNWRGISLGYSSNNIIYHNNFINNTNQTNVYDSPNNVWDNGYPSGGNYWSDYTGVDEKSGPNQDQLGSDGIGDTPYVITSFVNNRDRYPLMHPWSTLPVHNINTGLGYAKVQEAINAPETLNGNTIFVESGTYYENVIVNKTLSLIGENTETTIIDGKRTGIVVLVTASNVTVSGFTIKNAEVGMRIESDGNKIENNAITDNGCGISILFKRQHSSG
jgi:parallel beta-helix repeat protein